MGAAFAELISRGPLFRINGGIMRCAKILRHWRLSAVVLVSLLGLTLVAGSADDALRYPGDIEPLDASILLRYHPIDHYRTTVAISFAIFDSERQTGTMSATMDNSVRRTDTGLVWDTTTRIGAYSIDPRRTGKLNKGRCSTDDRGHVLSVERPDLSVPRDDFIDIVARLQWLLPADPVSPGQDLMAAPVSFDLADMMNRARDSTGKERLKELSVHLDLDAIVAGQTSFEDRRYLVVNVDGNGDVGVADNRVRMEIHGYMLMDMATAIVSHSRLHADLTGSVVGKRVQGTLDMLSATTWD